MDQIVEQEHLPLRRDLGEDILKTIQNAASKSPEHSLLELVANSYDSDASLVQVTYEPEQGRIIIRDNGSGMDMEGAQAFVRTGDSLKRNERVSRGGRHRLGRFGTATILIGDLGNEYQVETVRDGKRIIFGENLESLIVGDPIGVRVEDAIGMPNGTTINIYDLKITTEDEHKRVRREFLKKIQRELPIWLPDFSVEFNGEEVVAKKFSRGVSFDASYQSDSLRVEGSISYLNQKQSDAGLYLYVNNRVIGEPKALLDKLTNKASLRTKVIGEIHVNCLEDAIRFDRGGFRDGDPRVIELEEHLKDVLSNLRRYVDGAVSDSGKISRLEAQIPTILEGIYKQMKASEIISGDTLLEVGQLTSANVLGEYVPDAETPRITLNTAHPRFTLLKGMNRRSLESHLLSLAMSTMAASIAGKASSSEELLKAEAELWHKFNKRHSASSFSQDPDSKDAVIDRIVPKLLYSIKDARLALGDLALAEFRHLQDTGVIDMPEVERVAGQQLISYLEKTREFQSMFSYLYEREDNYVQSLERFGGYLQAGADLFPIFVDFSMIREKNAFFVDKVCLPLLDIYMENGRRYKGSFFETFQRRRPVNKLGDTFPDFTRSDIDAILGLASEEDLEVVSDQEVISIPRFVDLSQKYRGIDLNGLVKST